MLLLGRISWRWAVRCRLARVGTESPFWGMPRCWCGSEDSKAIVAGDGDQEKKAHSATVPKTLPTTPYSERGVGTEESHLVAAAVGHGRPRAWRRSLSPLARVSGLIPDELLSREVVALRNMDQQLNDVLPLRDPSPDSTADEAITVCSPGTPSDCATFSLDHTPLCLEYAPPSPGCRSSGLHVPIDDLSATANHTNSSVSGLSLDTQAPTAYSGSKAKERPFKPGDLVVAEFRKKHNLEFRKMFSLTAAGKLHSNWGMLLHQDVLGNLPGQVLRSTSGFKFLLRRPSLEEFVLLMKRGPTISYPKDVNTMLMMMDVNRGDHILEAGSGSGAMTLFLSRAVGSQGHVLSFETRIDHHTLAKKNFHRWRAAWLVSHDEEWPENVDFINQDIAAAADVIKEMKFDAIALDMISPQVALPVVHPYLKQGGVCAVYLANITQVIDLLEGVRSCQISLLCEKVIEVTHRDWLVTPAKRKDGSTAQRVEPPLDGCEEFHTQEHEEHAVEGELVVDDVRPFGTVPYIARPHHQQASHTAFLVRLRKFKPESEFCCPR